MTPKAPLALISSCFAAAGPVFARGRRCRLRPGLRKQQKKQPLRAVLAGRDNLYRIQSFTLTINSKM